MNRQILLIVISSIIGLLTAGAYAGRIQNLRNEISDMTEKVTVLTAKRDLAAGDSLQNPDLGIEFRLKTEVSRRSVATEDLDLILGRKIFHPVPSGEVILWTDLSEGPRLRKPSEKIPEGYRAIALPADEIHTMTHFISPGDMVDIVWSNFTEAISKIDSSLIAERVRVLGVGQKLEEWSRPEFGEDYPLSVTLLVTPKTALQILKASQSGEIHFLARGSDLFSANPGENPSSDITYHGQPGTGH